MNLLFTSVGRRVELLQAFHGAAQKLRLELTICGADISETAPALCFCDKKFIVPKINDPQYIPTLIKICEQEKIAALIPTIDTDLMILAESKELFAQIGTLVVVSDPEKIGVCRDKNLTAEYFMAMGLKTPLTFCDVNAYNQGFPAFIKPKDGSSSINAFKAENEKELGMYAEQVPDYIIQPYVDGVEYTVDAFCDLNGNPIFITPRIRLVVRAGEVLKTEIRMDDTIISEVKQFLNEYKPCGAVTIQLIKNRNTSENWYIEINPRFGGGAPLSMKAGADSAEALLRLLHGERVEYAPFAADNGSVFSRFDQSVRVK